MAVGGPPPPARVAGLAAAFALATAACFWPVRQHAWLNYDDDIYVTASEPVRAGLTHDSLFWAFTTFQGANWFPLTRLSWMLDAELHGLDATAFHTTDLVLHALCAALCFAALARLTGSTWRSAFVAGVFAWHPLHVESVAWIAARKDPLSALFFFLSLLVYERHARRGPTPTTHALLLACLVLGLMAKPILVTLPCVWLLLDAWPLGRLAPAGARGDGARLDPRRLRAALLEKLPAFAVVAGFSALTVVAQGSAGALAPTAQLPLPARAANAVVACAVYLRRALWPSDLAVFYPHPGEGIAPAAVAAAAAVLLALSALAALAWRRVPAVTIGWLWYLVTLVPVLGLVQVGSQAMADRYTYLSLVGVAIAVAWGVPALLPRRAAPALAAAAAVALALCAAATRAQLSDWRDSAALFERALAVTEDNHIAHAHLGSARLAQGRVADAAAHWREALRIRPDFERAANNLAWLLATAADPDVRDPAAALPLAERAARLSGREPAVLDTLAAAYAANRRFPAARRVLAEAIEAAEAAGETDLAREFRARMALYREDRPYIDEP